MQAVMQNAAAAPARSCSTSGRRHLTAAPAMAPAVAAHAGQQRRQRSMVAHARVELQDLDGKVHILEVAADKNILEVALDDGLDLPYDCRMGVCLRCCAKINTGKVEQLGGMISEDRQEQGYALMCITYPLEDCSMRIIPEDEVVNVVMNIV